MHGAGDAAAVSAPALGRAASADVLVAYATLPGELAWRDWARGS